MGSYRYLRQVPSAGRLGPTVALTTIALAATLSCAPAAARVPTARQPVARQTMDPSIHLADVSAGKGGFIINGTTVKYASSGASVAGAGDVNGDGLDDLIVGVPGEGPGSWHAGATYVVFGKPGTEPFNLDRIAAGQGGGFVIHGEGVNRNSGSSVAAAGDVNGDGLADVLIGVGVLFGSPTPEDRSYVVFGKADTAPVELSAVAAGQGGGFAIHGISPNDVQSFSVAAAGDFNGDGLADVAVGVLHRSEDLKEECCYVVFGKTDTAQVELSAVAQGAGGVAIKGEAHWGAANIAGAGDFNGDGLADLVVGMPEMNDRMGRSYVVFGRHGTAQIDLAQVSAGEGGFRLDGGVDYDVSGSVVAAAGDMNGDGLADVLITAPGKSQRYGRWAKGVTYVIFGHKTTAPVALTDIEAGRGKGFAIYGESIRYDYSGRSAVCIGDMNGDGLSDLLIGAPGADADNVYAGGRSYVVYGKADTANIDLRSVTGGAAPGVTILGEAVYSGAGTSVGAAGDVNGDGFPDLIIGAPDVDLPGADGAGRSYVVFGGNTTVFDPTAFDQVGTPGNDTLTGSAASESMAGGAGNDVLVGNGGADVLYGGPGDDTLVLNAGNVTALRSPLGSGGNVQQLARVEGGAGFDTLSLSGGGITLDLRHVSSQGMSLPGNLSRIESIERIDLTGNGDNQLRLAVADVHDMTGMNLINAGNRAALGWTNGSYKFAQTTRRHQLVVDGNAGDSLTTAWPNWKNAGTVFRNGQAYTVWNSIAGRAQLLVNQQVQPASDALP